MKFDAKGIIILILSAVLFTMMLPVLSYVIQDNFVAEECDVCEEYDITNQTQIVIYDEFNSSSTTVFVYELDEILTGQDIIDLINTEYSTDFIANDYIITNYTIIGSETVGGNLISATGSGSFSTAISIDSNIIGTNTVIYFLWIFVDF